MNAQEIPRFSIAKSCNIKKKKEKYGSFKIDSLCWPASSFLPSEPFAIAYMCFTSRTQDNLLVRNLLIFLCLALPALFLCAEAYSLYILWRTSRPRLPRSTSFAVLSSIFMPARVVNTDRHTHSHGWTNAGKNRNANRRNEGFPFSSDWTVALVYGVFSRVSCVSKTVFV